MLRLPLSCHRFSQVPIAFRHGDRFLMYYREEPVPFSLVPVMGLFSGSGVWLSFPVRSDCEPPTDGLRSGFIVSPSFVRDWLVPLVVLLELEPLVDPEPFSTVPVIGLFSGSGVWLSLPVLSDCEAPTDGLRSGFTLLSLPLVCARPIPASAVIQAAATTAAEIDSSRLVFIDRTSLKRSSTLAQALCHGIKGG
jgi:hypothetical protein